MITRGSDITQGLQRMDKGLWDHPAMDPDSCGVVNVLAPIGPWAQSEYSSPLFCIHIAVYLLCMDRGTNAPNRRKP